MKNIKLKTLLMSSIFVFTCAQASENCQQQKDLVSEVSDNLNTSVVLEATSIMLGLESNQHSLAEDSSEITVPKSVNNSARLSEL